MGSSREPLPYHLLGPGEWQTEVSLEQMIHSCFHLCYQGVGRKEVYGDLKRGQDPKASVTLMYLFILLLLFVGFLLGLMRS